MSLGIDIHIQVETTSFAPKVSFHDENRKLRCKQNCCVVYNQQIFNN